MGSLKRLLTGIVLVVIVVFVLLYTSTFWVLAVSSLLTLLALSEYNRLSALKIRDKWFDLLGVLAGITVPPLFYLSGTGAFMPAVIVSLFVFFLYGFFSKREFSVISADAAFKTMGLVYVAVPFALLAPISSLELGSGAQGVGGEWWILYMFAVIWSNDTFAYIAGKSAGRHKLCTSISPGKTVEGAIGGIVGGVVAAVIFDRYAGLGMGLYKAGALSIVLGVVGIIGDLSESLLKRSAGVKDSGSIVPGHGGVLDRVDSLLFAIPVLYFYLTKFETIGYIGSVTGS